MRFYILFYVFLAVSAGVTNGISVRLAARIQIFFTFLKLAGLVTIIVGGIITLSKGNKNTKLFMYMLPYGLFSKIKMFS